MPSTFCSNLQVKIECGWRLGGLAPGSPNRTAGCSASFLETHGAPVLPEISLDRDLGRRQATRLAAGVARGSIPGFSNGVSTAPSPVADAAGVVFKVSAPEAKAILFSANTR